MNHVVRNINRQILKYYAKEYDPTMDWEELDDKVDVLERYCKFDSKHEKNKFIYIDYPFEIFASANVAEKNLAVKITNWLSEITNIEDEDIRIVFFSMNEEALTIQSSFFFLSKMGCRVRKVIFPKTIDEVFDECDVVVAASKEFLDGDVREGKKVVLINRDFNEDKKDKAFLSYANLSEIIDDNNFFKKVK